MLQSAEGGGERLLLVDVRSLGAGALPVLSAEELTALGCVPEGAFSDIPEDVVVLCRMRIPHDRPQDAGFDLGRLVFVNRRNGRALEAMRSGAPLVPLDKRR